MKQKILFLEQQSWRGGGQRVLESVLEALDNDFQPIVAFPDDGPFRDALASRGIETVSYPLGSYRPGKKSFREMISFALRSILCVLKLAGFILLRNVRMIYINGPRCLPAGALAARLTGRPSLFHLHIVLTRRPEMLVASLFTRLATKIVACSNAVAKYLLRASPRLQPKIEVLYNPVPILPPAKSSLNSSPYSPFTIGMVGRITEGKGQHILIEAVSNLSPELRRSCRLLFVGAPGNQSTDDGIYFAQLKEKTHTLDLDNQTAWAGFQSDVNCLYSNMDVLAFPSVGTEGLPLAVLEAMQRGLPVIATNTGGTTEIVEHGRNGFLVAPGNAGDLANALAALMSDSRLLAQLGAGARATIDDRFSPERFSMAIERFAFELCPPSPSPHAIRERAEVKE